MRCFTPNGSLATSMPETNARPDVGKSSVERILMRVVLPAPFGPSRPKSSPSATSRLTPSRATTRRPRGHFRDRLTWKTRLRFSVRMARPAGRGRWSTWNLVSEVDIRLLPHPETVHWSLVACPVGPAGDKYPWNAERTTGSRVLPPAWSSLNLGCRAGSGPGECLCVIDSIQRMSQGPPAEMQALASRMADRILSRIMPAPPFGARETRQIIPPGLPARQAHRANLLDALFCRLATPTGARALAPTPGTPAGSRAGPGRWVGSAAAG